MWTFVFALLLLSSGTIAELSHSWRCAEGSRRNVSVEATPIPGSYVVTYCAPVEGGEADWSLRVGSLPRFTRNNCTSSRKTESRYATSHSWVLVPVKNINCSYICVTTQLYLLHHGCFRLENKWGSGEPFNEYYFVDDANITGPEYFCHGSLFFHNLGTVPPTFHLYQGHMPVDEYSITVQSNTTDHEPSINVSRNCTPLGDGMAGLRCSLDLPQGCYDLQLDQRAPWFANAYYASHCRLMHHGFCWEEPASEGRSVPLWIWVVSVLGLVLVGGVLALLVARTSPLSRKLTEEAAKALHKRREAVSELSAARNTRADVSAVGTRRVLLLRARDAEPAEQAQQILLQMLELAAPGQVLDLYSEEVVSSSACAPGEWVRQLLASEDVQVVVLQTPAMACLHRMRIDTNDDHVKLLSPLLPSQVVYRCPHPSDALLQLALRLLAEGPLSTQRPYRRYFLATLSDVPVDMFPSVVPYSRYLLPSAALPLLREINVSVTSSHALDALCLQMTESARQLAEYVRDNHNYLADELMFL